MIVGIDVTHPGPGSLRGTPSIAAVVASCEPNDFAQYPCSLEIQESKKEVRSPQLLCFWRLLTRLVDGYELGQNDGRPPDSVQVKEQKSSSTHPCLSRWRI